MIKVSSFWDFEGKGGTHSEEIENILAQLKQYLKKVLRKAPKKKKIDELTYLLFRFIFGKELAELEGGKMFGERAL